MTRYLAIGAIIGFAVSVLTLSLLENRSAPPAVVDAGSPALVVKHREELINKAPVNVIGMPTQLRPSLVRQMFQDGGAP